MPLELTHTGPVVAVTGLTFANGHVVMRRAGSTLAAGSPLGGWREFIAAAFPFDTLTTDLSVLMNLTVPQATELIEKWFVASLESYAKDGKEVPQKVDGFTGVYEVEGGTDTLLPWDTASLVEDILIDPPFVPLDDKFDPGAKAEGNVDDNPYQSGDSRRIIYAYRLAPPTSVPDGAGEVVKKALEDSDLADWIVMENLYPYNEDDLARINKHINNGGDGYALV